jgi:hypothetical protein
VPLLLGLVVVLATWCADSGAAWSASPSSSQHGSRFGARKVQVQKDIAGQPIPFGTARYFGGVRPSQIGSGVVGIAASSGGHGYWLATSDGTVLAYGGAETYGSPEGKGHVVAIVATSGGHGYWLASSTGTVFHFGDAGAHGSVDRLELSTPIVAMEATPDGGGYWLAALGGRVFALGDAQVYGTATPQLSNDHIVAIAGMPDGKGYWLAASDGRVFAFGDARSYGSAAGELLSAHLVAMAATSNGRGYWLAASDGQVFAFGGARLYGTATSVVGKDPIIAMTIATDGRGYWLLPTRPPGAIGLPSPGPGFLVGHVTAIGDSVMLDAEPDLEADIPGIDVEAVVSRQWYTGVALAQQLKSEGRLGATVIVDLGTNGPVTPAMFTQMMDVLAGASRVVFVTVHLPSRYSWSQSVNATLEQCVPLYPRARLADFNRLADEHPEWFYGDGVHMPIGGPGAQAMALVIKAQL